MTEEICAVGTITPIDGVFHVNADRLFSNGFNTESVQQFGEYDVEGRAYHIDFAFKFNCNFDVLASYCKVCVALKVFCRQNLTDPWIEAGESGAIQGLGIYIGENISEYDAGCGTSDNLVIFRCCVQNPAELWYLKIRVELSKMINTELGLMCDPVNHTGHEWNFTYTAPPPPE